MRKVTRTCQINWEAEADLERIFYEHGEKSPGDDFRSEGRIGLHVVFPGYFLIWPRTTGSKVMSFKRKSSEDKEAREAFSCSVARVKT